MAIYRNVQMSFWTDSKVMDDFTPEDKLFFLYLMTNPRTSLCGCYECSKKQMSRDTGYSEETISNIIYRMDKVHGVAMYDEATREILVVNWDKYNWTDSMKVLDGAFKGATKIKSKEFKLFVLKKLEQKGYPVPEEVFAEIGYTYPMDKTVTFPFTFTDNINNIQSLEVINNTSNATAKVPQKKPTDEELYGELFTKFYTVYPKHKDKQDAKRAFFRVMKSGKVEFDDIMTALEKQCKTWGWQKDNGQFVPYPATWLNKEKWADEIDPSEFNAPTSRTDYPKPKLKSHQLSEEMSHEYDLKELARRAKE